MSRRKLIVGALILLVVAGATTAWLITRPPHPPRDRLANMILVPAGPFLYGPDRQEIELPAFYIDRYEVSQADYARFLEFIRRTGDHARCDPTEPSLKHQSNHSPLGWGLSYLSHPSYPVVGLDYWDAYAYAQWVGKRLPTEQEWEKAARGTDGRDYPWGDEWDPSRCNWGQSPQNYRTLMPVDSMPEGQSPYGCYHMLGNAAEWTDSFYDDGQSLRAGRGYCWRLGHMVPNWVVTYRMHGAPFLRDEGSGLRCALNATQATGR